MSSIVQFAPHFTAEDAQKIALDIYGIKGIARQLPSERDQNFHLLTDSEQTYVLKIANTMEKIEVLDFQNQAMSHLHQHRDLFTDNMSVCPQVCRSLEGEAIERVQSPNAESHFIRLLTYLPGKPFAKVKPHDPGLVDGLGRFFGRIDKALEDFEHPRAHREFHWDLGQATAVIEGLLEHIDDLGRQNVVKKHFGHYQANTEPKLKDLRQSVIHNDGNDYNVLVRSLDKWRNRVDGIIDFGDMVYTQMVNELAIICAYAMLEKKNPLQTAKEIVKGYHHAHPLQEMELAVLFDLICMRLCMSVCHSAHQTKLEPENAYLRISEVPAWKLLYRLAEIHPQLAHFLFRDACDLPPVPHSNQIVSWLGENSHKFATVVDAEFRHGNQLVLDLSVGSSIMDTADMQDDTVFLDETINKRMRENNVNVAIGKYNEARFFYTTDAFLIESEEMPERRTIHLGIDLHLEAGSPIYAFMEGKVHSFQNNDIRRDYGPTIILEHEINQDLTFYTLYGHLSLDSLADMEIGKTIQGGQQFASVGDMSVNGGWPPHLHFQIITDMMGEKGNFPGVAPPSRRKVWQSISPDPNVVLGISKECFVSREKDRAGILAVRNRHIGKNFSIAYDKPLKIVRGRGQYLFDQDGQAYLDGVNNVSHVGHCHPAVVAAGQQQMAVLNTNTRYLHDNIVEYAERLLAKFPDPLRVCFFVCTGSEANELAFRLARNHTSQNDIISLDGAYHGNTNLLIDVSPYKHAGPGGKGAPSWVHTVVMPDGYRGPHKGTGHATGIRYAEYVKDAILKVQSKGRSIAAFICESVLGCGGQVVLPDKYMREAFKHVREAGGICLADEVQVGFGRVGSHFWAFETQDCVPDIVTLGKPMGNGHPLAVVITTPEIAETFNNGMEYFNTFGGNPVSCAIGMAVLDVIEKEGLQENAQKVGSTLLRGFQQLKNTYPLIGDVRGLGLFLGVELVKDRETREPAPEHAAYIINRLHDYGILISTDGPLHNVLKFKPPIVFSDQDAGNLLDALDKILGEDCLQP